MCTPLSVSETPPVEYVQSFRIVDSRNRFAARNASVLPDGFSTSTVGNVSEEAEFAFEEERKRRRRPSNRGDAERSCPLTSTEQRDGEFGLDIIPLVGDASMTLVGAMWSFCRPGVAKHPIVTCSHAAGVLQFSCCAVSVSTGVVVSRPYERRNIKSERRNKQTDLVCDHCLYVRDGKQARMMASAWIVLRSCRIKL